MVAAYTMILLSGVSQIRAPAPVATSKPFSETGHRIALETLVQSPEVLSALGVDEPAKANLEALRRERAEQVERVRRLLEVAPGPERSKLLAETIATPAISPQKVTDALKQILGDEKFGRLKQIQRQLLGPAILFEAAEELALTPDQRTRLLELSASERAKALSPTKAVPDLRREQLAEARKRLTSNQQRILDDLLGLPSGVVLKQQGWGKEYGLRRPPYSVWHASQRSPVIYLGFPEVRRWLNLNNWADIENLLVEENDVEAVVAFTADRFPSSDAEALAERALMTRKERMFKLEEAVFRRMSAQQVARLKNLKYQIFDSAPYSWPTADLLGVTHAQRQLYIKGSRDAWREKRHAQFDRFQYLTPEQRKKWDELRGEPVPENLIKLCKAVGDTRWRPQLREGLAAKLPAD